jgi:hypothetical protein
VLGRRHGPCVAEPSAGFKCIRRPTPMTSRFDRGHRPRLV